MIGASSSYDDVPYDTLAFPQSHPDRLATVARIFGLTPPEVAVCRVLELGCASGGKLIPTAVNSPRADFTGVDLSARSILDADGGLSAFDYAICCGVFS